ncbi:MAG TPA: PAS domain S-box protein [Candidatus Limnocylindrales bacterium]|nr:PAS domain S-box protein [Candidatus Limnocylindrales bacterium]
MASARTRSKASRAAPSAAPTEARPAGAAAHHHARAGDVDALLQGAAEEAARLLGADGAFLYLAEPETGRLRFTHSAGISALPADHRIRTLELPVGVGMFGKAVADRRVVVTGDYGADTRFVHAEATDSFVDEIEIRSMVVAPLSAGDEVFGALGTFSRTPDAFTAPQIALVRALSDHAALAMANARLIEELDLSRDAIERQATIERSLRELGTRISGARDPEAVVQHTIDEALRLLDGDGARIDIVDPEVRQLRGLYSSGEEQILETEWPRDPNDTLEVGASGRAVLTGQTYISRDYLTDTNLVHGHGPDTYARTKGIHGVIATPLFGDQGPFGAITVWSTKEDAFGPDDAALLETIAGQSAVALGRARLIEELGRSRETLARRAEEERALREIASRLGAMGDDPADILNRIVNETARLLGGERARLDLLEPLSGSILWTYPPQTPFNDRIVTEELVGDGPAATPTGLAGLAIHEGRPVVSGDYMRDTRFHHYPEGDEGVTSVGLHSIVATPVIGEEGLLGVLQAGHRAIDAFGEDAIRLIGALATQAAIAITNARLVDRLASSQAALERTAEAERSLREIARRMMTIQDPGELLQDVVDEAARLLGSSGAVIDLLDPATGEVRWAYDAGIDEATRTGSQERKAGNDGVFLAIRERRVIVTDDYAADPRFADGPPNAAFLESVHVRSMAFAPLIGDAVVLGTLAVHAPEVGRFDEEAASTLAALADLATIAIHNAELIRELGRSREETAHRAETERTLREIVARVTAIRDPDTILGLIVDETRRVLGSDGAHLTRMSEDRTFLRPVVIAGGMDEVTRDWLQIQQFPLDGGINGLAAGQGRIVWTPNYATDPRIPRDEDDLEVAQRMGLGAMAAAPLHAPGGEVIGTLAISYRTPGPISQDRLTLLQALADHAAIALSNSDLLARLETSEASFRGLVQATPDVIWRNDAEGRFTFMAEGAEQLFGWKAEEMVGRHFGEIVAPGSHDDAGVAWERLATTPDAIWRLRFLLARKDGSVFPAEVSAVTSFEGGEFRGAQGTLRDISERERLERDLRASEERYRGLVQSSPDLIFEMDGDGVYTFYSDRTEEVIGWSPEEMIGRPFTDFIDMEAFPQAAQRLAEISANPGKPSTDRLLIRHKSNGRKIPFEVSVVGQVDETGRLQAIRGVARDISERERLENQLRASEERYRFLLENAPDIVFSMDAETRFLFISDTIERLTGFTPAELIGDTFDKVITPETLPIAMERWAIVAADPSITQVLRLELRNKDGGSVPVEVHSVGQRDGSGAFAGVHGSARDIGERERLERELRESEERYRSVIQSSPDLIWATNRAGQYVFVSDRVRDLLGWEPDEVLGRPFREFIDEQSVEMTNEEWARLAQEPGRTQTHRLDIRHKDGSLRPFEVSSVAVVRDGEVENVYGIARDVAERERLERELRESEERYRFLVENSPDVIYATDAAGVITYFSESVERALGWVPQEIIGRHFRDIVRTSTPGQPGRRFMEMAAGMPDLTTRMELMGKDGTYRPFEVTAAAMRIDGVFTGVHGSARDVRERERLERELRDSEERYRYLVQSSPDLVWMTDADGQFTFISDQAEQILGWEPHELLGRSFADLAPDEGRRGAIARFRWLQRRPTEAHRSRLNVRTRDGRELAMEVTGIGMVADGQFLGAHGAARDVSDRERLERGLRRQAAELASSEERAHLARELHDSVTQALFSMTLLSRSIELLLDKDPAQVPGKLASLRELQRDALAEMRALIFELRPGNIEEHGLIAALRTHSASLSGRIGLPVVVEADLGERPSLDVEETLYRIAQEALHNVVKHAGARQVRLELDRVAEGVRLRVIDDGRGFDPSAVPDGHLGLTGMRSRAERLGGHLTVTTGHGAGTTIEVVVPETIPEHLARVREDELV